MISKKINKGIESFFNKNFENALLNFSLALEKDMDSKEAKIGAILTDMAIEQEDEATALFEYYLLIKDSGSEKSEELMEEIINSIDLNLENIENLFFQNELESKLNEENGIAYEDFENIVQNKDSFKEAFEDIMFSTKVIIHKKDDFLDFIGQLIDNGFKEISLNYFESAVQLYPNDKKLLSLIKKVEETNNCENRNQKKFLD